MVELPARIVQVPGLIALHMRQHEMDENTQISCCDALSQIARGNDVQRHEVLKAEGHVSVVDAMVRHRANVRVQRAGSAALASIASASQEELLACRCHVCSRPRACRPCKHVSLFVEIVVELFAGFSF